MSRPPVRDSPAPRESSASPGRSGTPDRTTAPPAGTPGPSAAVLTARALALAAVPVLALAPAPTHAGAGDLTDRRPTVRIARVPRPPVLEDFLEMRPPADLADSMAHVTGFTQQTPEDGKPASQKTDVYLGYDETTFYAVFVCFDDEPGKIRSHLTRREDVFGDETIEIQLDTFDDQRRAFSFLTNPLGIQWDAIWTEGLGFDGSWDTVWHSRGRVTGRGYVVLMAIPFKSLRFPSRDEQTWGLVFVRDIPRNNEVSFWPRVSNRIAGRLNQEATLVGLEGISPGRNIQLIPYASARRFRRLSQAGDRFERESGEPDAGVDAKFVIDDRVALDVTVNPDFSQVESDQPQVTVNERFEVFFPERRPFFLENADYFSTPIDLLFTRRIDEPRAGARTTGKLGRFAIGALFIDDQAPGEEVDPTSPAAGDVARFGVLRVSRDVDEQSQLGLIYTEREFAGERNRVGGVDGRFRLGSNWWTRFQAVHARTESPSGTEADPAYSLELNRDGRKLTAHLHYFEVGPEFRTRTGFVRRRDIRDAHQRWAYRFRPEGPRLVAWGPTLFVQHIEDHDGTRLDWSVQARLDWEYRRQTSFGIVSTRGRERLRATDLPASVADPDRVSRDYSSWREGVFFDSRYCRWLQVGVSLDRLRRFGLDPPPGELPPPAEGERLSVSLTIRPSTRLRIENRWIATRFDERDGGRIFTDQILQARVRLQLDRRLSFRAILRYDGTRPTRLSGLDRTRNVNGDLLATYLINPWTAFYVGYNSNHRDVDDPTTPGLDDALTNDSRELFAKFSYLIRP